MGVVLAENHVAKRCGRNDSLGMWANMPTSNRETIPDGQSVGEL